MEDRPVWFVGAVIEGVDYTEEFAKDGIWRYGGFKDKKFDLIKTIQSGDRIVIKSTYTQKHNLPFEANGNTASVMAIKATGTVVENKGDGRNLKVDWQLSKETRNWYFYTIRSTLWRVQPDEDWCTRALVDFAFDYIPQDLKKFCSRPYWSDRFGDKTSTEDSPKQECKEDIQDSSSYSLDDLMEDGCFLDKKTLEMILTRLKHKKNIILQGPPGTGKTWLGKRLAYALIGQKKRENIRALQFHPNLSYEDFIRGWRPSGDGRLSLIDGPFMEAINLAQEHHNQTFVIVIEEINRGNPAQVFGEMLTLLEVDKRKPSEALELCYSKEYGEKVFIPNNLYVIGTMNIADRSLALVDFAFRRRFAFIDLVPEINAVWERWVTSQCGLSAGFTSQIKGKMNHLNEVIKSDNTLGAQFCVGHSYVTPPLETKVVNEIDWFRQIVKTEIRPLLDEYWFEGSEKIGELESMLLEGL